MIEITDENIKAILNTIGEDVSGSEMELVRSSMDFGKVEKFFNAVIHSLNDEQRKQLSEHRKPKEK